MRLDSRPAGELVGTYIFPSAAFGTELVQVCQEVQQVVAPLDRHAQENQHYEDVGGDERYGDQVHRNGLDHVPVTLQLS